MMNFRCLVQKSLPMEMALHARSFLAMLCVASCSSVADARGSYDHTNGAEFWAWSKIRRNEPADFNQRCGTPQLDPKDEKDARWKDDCRKLSGKFLQDLITQSPWREAIPQGAIGVMGAHIIGSLDLSDVTLNHGISISSSQIDGSFDFSRADTRGLIDLNGSVMNGKFSAAGLRSESEVFLNGGMEFKDTVTLDNARITGNLDMNGAHCDAQVSLVGTKVGGSHFLGSARFEKPIIAGLMEIGGSLGMELSSFADADFTGSKIGGQVILIGSTFGGLWRWT